jgi:membrane protein implicated in regulation of membrane protease activity
MIKSNHSLHPAAARSAVCLARLARVLVGASIAVASGSAAAQSGRDVRGAAAVEPVPNEPPAKIVVDPPLAGTLSHGRVVIQYRTDNLHVAPVFGTAALAVSPRVGHVHVSVDDTPWVWVDASGEPVILNGLPAGPHKVLLELETANHQLLDQGAVRFTVPEVMHAHGAAAARPVGDEPAPKLIIDPVAPEPLSRGVAFITYRAEHLRIVPVFGEAAVAISPRVGHIHVTVDDARWHWADASGNPIIINGLAPGRHKLLIDLVTAAHQVIHHGVVEFLLPATKPMVAGH